MPNPWTPERVEIMTKLWTDGSSAGEIARELKNGISRNAVIGKLARLGLQRQHSGICKPVHIPRARLEAKARARKPITPPAPKPPAPAVEHVRMPMVNTAPVRLRVVAVPDDAAPVDLIDATRFQCRWMLDDRLCCGAPVGQGSYCASHAALSTVSVRPKRPGPRDLHVIRRDVWAERTAPIDGRLLWTG